LICNLKSHKDYAEILEYREKLKNIKTDIKLIIAPSNLYLNLFKGYSFATCCQNLDLYSDLEVTGSVPIKDLVSLGVTYTLVGHYERRKYYGETDNQIISKVNAALQNKLKVIYCIGESKEELDRRVEYQVIERSIAKILNNVPNEEFKNIIIAYEPTYLIGKDTPYNIAKIKDTIIFIKKLVYDYYGENIKVVFGGNINLDNIDSLLSIPEIDGFIMATSIINPENIPKILDKMTTSL